MAENDRARRLLYERTAGVMGSEAADVLLDSLPPIGWGEIARRDDVELLGRELRAEIAALRTETHGELGQVRAEMAGLRAELHLDMARLIRTLVFTICAMQLATIGAVAALVR